MNTNKLPNDRDEKKLLLAIDKVTNLVDGEKLTPTEAVIKVAKEEKLSPGEIRLVCSAYNNGKQIAQFESNKNALDKLADFVLADADKVISAIYGSENNLFKKSYDINDIFEIKKYAFDLPPYWWEEYEKTAWLKSLDGNLLKTAAAETIFPEVKNKIHEENNDPLKNYETLRKSHQYIKAAIDQLHKESCTLKEEIRRNVNDLKNYLSYNENYRISNQTIKEGIDAYFGDNIYGMQLKELLFKNIKEEENTKIAQVKKLEKLSIDDYPLNKFAESVNLTKNYVQINNKINELDKQKKEIESELKKIAQHVGFKSIDKNKNIFNIDLRKEKINSPYYLDLKKNILYKEGQSNRMKVAAPTPPPPAAATAGATPTAPAAAAAGTAAAGAAASAKEGKGGALKKLFKTLGLVTLVQKLTGSKPENEVEKEIKKLKDLYHDYLTNPGHVNKLKYMEGLPIVVSAMLDEEDPISAYHPEKVLKAYNELAVTMPDLVTHPAVVKPILRKYLAGNFEPFEAKEIMDMQEKYLRSKHIIKDMDMKEKYLRSEYMLKDKDKREEEKESKPWKTSKE